LISNDSDDSSGETKSRAASDPLTVKPVPEQVLSLIPTKLGSFKIRAQVERLVATQTC